VWKGKKELKNEAEKEGENFEKEEKRLIQSFDEIWMMGFCDGFYNLSNALMMTSGVITWPMHDLS